MNTKNDFDQISDFFHKVTLNYLKQLKDSFDLSSYENLLLEKSNSDVAADTLVVNFGSNGNPLAISFTFIPIPDSEIHIDTVLLQIYSILPSKPKIETLSELEKSLNFINNQLPIGHLGISNGNKITLKSIQALSTNNYDMDINLFQRITDLFQMIISIFNPSIDDVCRGNKTFKQLAYELSN